MTAVSLFLPLSLSYPPPTPNRSPPSTTHQWNPISLSSCLGESSNTLKLNLSKFGGRSRTVTLVWNSNESEFLGEDGVVEDMDGYLNSLSLEYDSVWDTKPSWCQPWTITLTGVLVVACSWLILHSVVITTIALSLICFWWYIFLYSYPKMPAFLYLRVSSHLFVWFLLRPKNGTFDNFIFFSSSYCYLQAYTEMIADRRRRVTSGVEDTFGVRKNQ